MNPQLSFSIADALSVVLPLIVSAAMTFSVSSSTAQTNLPEKISIEKREGSIAVSIGEGDQKELFTEYRFTQPGKPILFPVYGPDAVPMTRHYPMDDTHANEAQDHPHHQSIWFAHGDVNGIDFWAGSGVIKNRTIEEIADNRIVATNDWMDDDKVICQDCTTIQFSAGDNWRMIDYSVTILASSGDLVFGDTKEGTFAIRTHPALRLLDRERKPAGQAVNSEGVEGLAVWGQKARWVHYHGVIDDETYSVTMIDHPDSLRHPTTWHAREYGLLAANPFGLAYFQDAKPGTGNHRITEGESVTFRYGLLFAKGEKIIPEIDESVRKFTELPTSRF